jgi:hypothetical protein
MADDAVVGPVTQYQAQGIDQDGLAGAGFTGEYGHPGAEFNLHRVGDGEIANVDVRQHMAGLRPNKFGPTENGIVGRNLFRQTN